MNKIEYPEKDLNHKTHNSTQAGEKQMMMRGKKVHEKYHGIMTPVLMPFHEDKSLDFDALAKFIDWQCQQPVDILFPMGGSGEYWTLELEERKKIIDVVLEVAGKRKLVFIGTGADTLEETIELCQHSQHKGADGVGVVIPTNIPDEEDAIFSYYKAINDATDLPFMVYDPRGEGSHTATPALMRRMVDEFEHLVAIKYRTVNGENMGFMAKEVGDEISIFSGSETVFLQDLSVGCVGCVGGGGNFYPQLMKELQGNFEKGDLVAAREIQFKILDAIQVLNDVYWPLSGKVILQELGFPYKLVTRVPAQPYHNESINLIRDYFRKFLHI